jgi:hypothetical protein
MTLEPHLRTQRASLYHRNLADCVDVVGQDLLHVLGCLMGTCHHLHLECAALCLVLNLFSLKITLVI